MRLRSILCRHVLIRSLVWVSLLAGTVSTSAGQILGIGPEGTFAIDPSSGSVTFVSSFGLGDYIGGFTTSGVPGVVYFTTGVNLYTANIATNTYNYLGFLPPNGAGELAYDVATGVLYRDGAGGAMYSGQADGCPFGTDCYTPQYVAALPDVSGYDVVSGGLYGISNFDDDLYRIDLQTDQITIIGPTGIPAGDGIMDLAYDADDGLFVASAIVGSADRGAWVSTYASTGTSGTDLLFTVNPVTGAATYLATSPAPLVQLVENTPEPATGALALCGLAGLLLAGLAPGRRRPARPAGPINQ